MIITPRPFKGSHEEYKGDCDHGNIGPYDFGYGFCSWLGVRGLGAYHECPDCGAAKYDLDEECATEDEIEWYENSVVSKGWFKVAKEEECQNALQE